MEIRLKHILPIFFVVLLALVLACISSRINNPISPRSTPPKIEGIQSFHFSTYGSMRYSGSDYSVHMEDDKVLVSIRTEGQPEENTAQFEVGPAFIKELEEIATAHNLLSWDGFNKSNKHVLDGSAFSMGFTLSTGQTISARGYMEYPKNYSEAAGELHRLFISAHESVHPLCNLQEVSFRYGLYDGTMIEANITSINRFGGNISFIKQKGASHRDDIVTREASFYLNEEQVEELRRLLFSFDLPKLNALPRGTYGYGAGVHLKVVSGYKTYYIDQLTKFPKQVPPLADTVYIPLYNYFNKISLLKNELAQIELDMLLDPYLDPVNNPRTVFLYGKERSLVPGTGNAEGYRATVDFEGKKWWVEENFVGTWRMTEEDKLVSDPGIGERYYITNKSAELIILEDGTGTFTLDGATHDIKLSEDFIYYIGGGFSATPREGSGGQWRDYDIDFYLDPYYGPHDEAHFNRIHISAPGMPPPDQKDWVSLLLTRQE